MKTTMGLMVALCGGLSLSAATYSDVQVRQLWPFSRNVEVSFMASEVTDLQRLTISVKEGDRVLGTVPASAYRETSGAVGANGRHRLEFDATAVPCLAIRGMCKDFSVSLSSTSLDPEEALYLVFDLTKSAGTVGQREIVTSEALRAGAWGDWQPQVWTNSVASWTDNKGVHAYTNKVAALNTPVWTGVTKDPKYALTHLVMRRIPAGTFKMGYASTADVNKKEPNISQRDVTLTKPYYIGVFEFTAKQVRLLTGSTNNTYLDLPTVNDKFDQIRGTYTTAGGAYDWPTDKTVDPNSYIGKLRARTGAAFDLPTEAQWEKAARAGSNGVYYDGCEATHKNERNAIAWNTEPWDSDHQYAHPVGQLKPNNYGLYDMLGNAWEWVLDWAAGAVDVATTDPEGPTAAGASYWTGEGVPKRMLRGGSFHCDYNRITLHERTQNAVNGSQTDYGWRVALPAE